MDVALFLIFWVSAHEHMSYHNVLSVVHNCSEEAWHSLGGGINWYSNIFATLIPFASVLEKANFISALVAGTEFGTGHLLYQR